MKKNVKELFNRVELGYIEPAMNPEFTFEAGDENEFVTFIKEYINTVYMQEKRLHKSTEVNTLLTTFLNSMNNFDYEVLWKKLNKNFFCDDTIKIYESVLKRISFDSLVKELDKKNDYKLVYNYYIFYGKLHNISKNEIIDHYSAYLDRYLERTNTPIEEVFSFFFNFIVDTMPYYHGNSTPRENIKYSFDAIVYGIEINGYSKKNRMDNPRFLVADSTPMSLLVHKLLPKVNLDYDIKFENEMKPLRYVIICILSDLYDYNKNDGIKKLIEKYLKLEKDKPLKLYKTNIFELNVKLGKMDEVERIINSEDFEFCSKIFNTLLREKDTYSIYQYTYPDDLLRWDLPNEKFSHENLLRVLFNDKVHMINIAFLYHALSNGYLTEDEFSKLLQHINEKGIIVYESYDNRVSRVYDISSGLNRYEWMLNRPYSINKRTKTKIKNYI